jgi:hypothetical protein
MFLVLCWRIYLPHVITLAVVALQLIWQPRRLFLLVFIIGLFPVVAIVRGVAHRNWRPNFWLWRLSRRVVRFRTNVGDRVTLLYAADVDGVLDLHEVMLWAESDLNDLSKRFGIHLERRLTIVLASSYRDPSADFGRSMGTIVLQANAVVLGADCPVRKALRHELAHLFAARWNQSPPPLLQEGLAVWLERTEQDFENGDERRWLLHATDMDVVSLLDPAYFFSAAHMHRSYALAGGFTDFLIRRFGWPRFMECYRTTHRLNFHSRFQQQFGITLADAWRKWRDETIAMKALERRMRGDQLFSPLL